MLTCSTVPSFGLSHTSTLNITGPTSVRVGQAIHRQQRQAEVTDESDHAVQRRLVDDRSDQRSSRCPLTRMR